MKNKTVRHGLCRFFMLYGICVEMFVKNVLRRRKRILVSGIINYMNEIHGNMAGLKSRTIEELKGLYEFKLSPQEFISEALVGEMARLTEVTGKEISIFLSRSGRVLDVSVGTDKSVKLPYMRVRYYICRLNLKQLLLRETHAPNSFLPQGIPDHQKQDFQRNLPGGHAFTNRKRIGTRIWRKPDHNSQGNETAYFRRLSKALPGARNQSARLLYFAAPEPDYFGDRISSRKRFYNRNRGMCIERVPAPEQAAEALHLRAGGRSVSPSARAICRLQSDCFDGKLSARKPRSRF